MTAIENFLGYLSENWVMILVLIGAALSIGKMISKYLSLCNEEKVEAKNNAIVKMFLFIFSKNIGFCFYFLQIYKSPEAIVAADDFNSVIS